MIKPYYKEEKKLNKKSKEFGKKLWNGEPIDLLDFYKTMKKLEEIDTDKVIRELTYKEKVKSILYAFYGNAISCEEACKQLTKLLEVK